MAQDTLEFWHPKQDIRLPDGFLNWGTVAPGSSEDKTFRVRNVSYTYTALEIVVSLTQTGRLFSALPLDIQHYLSRDGRTFTATAVIGDLAPRVVSDLLVLRRVTARNADVGLGEYVLTAKPGDWT